MTGPLRSGAFGLQFTIFVMPGDRGFPDGAGPLGDPSQTVEPAAAMVTKTTMTPITMRRRLDPG